jgi:hypothetical protein
LRHDRILIVEPLRELAREAAKAEIVVRGGEHSVDREPVRYYKGLEQPKSIDPYLHG